MRRLFVLLAALIVLALPVAPSSAEQSGNPFTGGNSAAPAPTEESGNPFSRSSKPGASPTAPAEIERVSGPMAAFGRWMITFQAMVSREVGRTMKAIKDRETLTPLLVGVLFAFLYGAIHTLGPGHGKFVVASYFVGNDANYARGFLMGGQIAVFHVLSAVIAVILADFLLRKAFGGAPSEVQAVRLFSYGTIAVIGVFMLVQATRRAFGDRTAASSCAVCGHDHAHGPEDNHDHAPVTGEKQGGQQSLLSIAVGAIPCTGALLILLYALANDLLFEGLLLVAAISVGMAITMSLIGMVSIVARRFVRRRFESGREGPGPVTKALNFLGAGAVTFVGSALFVTAL